MSERKISRYMGIDPGKSGALALLKYQDDHLLDVCIQDCPVLPAVKGKTVYDPAAMSALLRRWSSGEGTSHVFVEVVHSMPGQGVSSMFDFGKGFGMWLGILAALQIPHTLLTPQRWKKAMLADIKQD
jgi:crossover junction endodeoxyribonuclease RuvC